MKKNKWMILGLGTALMLTMAACSQQEAEETASPTPDPTNTPVQEEIVESPAAEPEEGAEAALTMTASFADEAGALLADTSVRFTVGDVEAEYVTAEDGTLTVASLPREGTLEVAVLDVDGRTVPLLSHCSPIPIRSPWPLFRKMTEPSPARWS